MLRFNRSCLHKRVRYIDLIIGKRGLISPCLQPNVPGPGNNRVERDLTPALMHTFRLIVCNKRRSPATSGEEVIDERLRFHEPCPGDKPNTVGQVLIVVSCHGQYLLTLIISCCSGLSASANIFSAARLRRPPSQPRAFYLLIMTLWAIPSFSHFCICSEIALLFSEDGCLLGSVNE